MAPTDKLVTEQQILAEKPYSTRKDIWDHV